MTRTYSRSRSRHHHSRRNSSSRHHRHHSRESSRHNHHHHHSHPSSHRDHHHHTTTNHSHRHRHRAHSRKHYTSSNSYKQHRKSYNDDSDRDDSIGHYLGKVGDVINKNYKIVKELGTGTFARAFEVKDVHTQNHYAVKVIRAVPRYCRHAKVEASIMEDITKRDVHLNSHCGHILNSFEFSDHFCMVLPLYGQSFYSVVKANDYKPFPLYLIRDYLKELFEAMEFIHGFGLTHTDLKLENVLFADDHEYITITNQHQQSLRIPQTKHIQVIDFGSSAYSTEKRTGIINTRQYRAPEVLVDLPWDEKSDIWGVACIAMELLTGDLLFSTHDDLLHFALIDKIVGTMPSFMIANLPEKKRDCFNVDGSFNVDVLHSTDQNAVRHQPTLEELIGEEELQFIDLMRKCLMIDPRYRISASEALNHPFFSESS